jgi:hypothetical protein
LEIKNRLKGNIMNEWIKAALVRAIKTAAQTAVALIGTNAIGITGVDWVAVASAAALAAVVSLLTSVAGIPEVREGKSPLEGR